MNKLNEVNEMFNYIESNINSEKVIKGGANDTQPYNTFRSGLNRIYDYFSVIFINNKANDEKYKISVDNLDKSCDCSKYKCKKEEDDIEVDDDSVTESDVIEKIDTKHYDSVNGSDVIEKIDMKNDDYINEVPSQSKLLLKVSKIV
jgi:hypothetical protein